MNKLITVEERVKVGIDYPDGKLIIPADIESIVRADRTTLKDTLHKALDSDSLTTRIACEFEGAGATYMEGLERAKTIVDEAKAIVSKVFE